jgi:hypothetical protein
MLDKSADKVYNTFKLPTKTNKEINMKKINKRCCRILAAVLCVLMLVPAFASCSSLGTPVMSLGSTEITGNMLEFWLSRYKAQMLYQYGSAIKNEYVSYDAFFDTIVEGTDKTYNTLFTEYVKDNARTYLGAIHLYNELGLSLPQAKIDEVDAHLDELIETYAEGSKQEFNTVLAQYGVNYDILREIYLMEEKVGQLQSHLFGPGGSEQITAADKEEYYKSHYVRLRQVYIFINECPKTDEKGNYITDSEGMYAYREMTADENKAAKEKAKKAYELLQNGTSFDTVLAEYDENTSDNEYKSGIYLSEESAYGNDATVSKIYDALLDMENGEYKMIESDYGIHIIQKIPLDDGAYNLAANEDFFTFWDSASQTYVNF